MDALASKLSRGYFTLEELGVKLADIRRLQDKGYRVHSVKREGKMFYAILTAAENVSHYISGATKKAQTVKWVEISDIHVGSKQFDETGLRQVLKRAVDEGFTDVHISGDLCDGYKVYPGHLVNLRMWKAEDQATLLAEILRDYPLNYFAITGNHDYSFEMQGGTNPILKVEELVPNFIYLPSFAADLVICGVLKRMIHGATGRAYALSYPGQTYIRNLNDAAGTDAYIHGRKYRIRFIQIGHFHSSIMYESAGMVITHPGNFQFPNEYTLRRALVGEQCGRFTTVVIQNGKVLEYSSNVVKPKR